MTKGRTAPCTEQQRVEKKEYEMNIEPLLYGLIMLFVGLIGIALKSRIKDVDVRSYSGANFVVGSYALLVCGIIVIILSFFLE